MSKTILQSLYVVRDEKYRDFQSRLIPTVDKSKIIGVRTPILRAMAREIMDKNPSFLSDLPHDTFEENQLHAFVLSQFQDFDKTVAELDVFLPYVDNWATCDQMSPRVLAKKPNVLIRYIKKWIASNHVYTVRFAILCLMRYFLDDNFDEMYMYMVLKIKSDNYYVNMMRAWYFATAAAKHYDRILPVFKKQMLDTWTHNRAIQKAIESYRIPKDNKIELKKLKKHL